MKRNNLDDSAFEFMLKEAVSQYADELNTEDVISDITDGEIEAKSDLKKRIYNYVMRVAKKDKPTPHIRLLSLKKYAALLVAVFVMITALAFSVSAFRIFLYKTYIDIKDQILNVSTKSTTFDNRTYEKIAGISKDKLIIPDWMPKDATINKISDEEGYVTLEYFVGNQYITLIEEQILSGQMDGNFVIENNRYGYKDIKVLGLDGKLIEIKSEQNLTCYSVLWNSDTMRYQLNTDVPEMMLNAILSSLKFYTN